MKLQITPEAFVRKVNDLLHAKEGCPDDAELALSPPGNDGASANGLQFFGTIYWNAVCGDIEKELLEKFDVPLLPWRTPPSE